MMHSLRPVSVLKIFGAFLRGGFCLLLAAAPLEVAADFFSVDTARKTPLAPEKVSESVTKESAATDWTSAGDSWVGKEKAVTPADFTALQVTDYYFSSNTGPGGTDRIFCSLARPVGDTEKLPVLLVFHGGGGHGDKALAVSVAQANPGFAVLAMDYNGQFRPSEGSVTQWKNAVQNGAAKAGDPADRLRMEIQYNAVIAARRAIDFLETFDWVDKKAIGAMGISYGGWVAFQLAACDERVRCLGTVVSAGGVSGTGSYTARQERTLDEPKAAAWREYVEPFAIAGSIRCPVFLCLCTNDRHFWLSGAERFLGALGSAEKVWQLRPNSDHNSGGPPLPDPLPLWMREHLSGDKAAFPVVGNPVVENGTVRWKVTGSLPCSCKLWWSPGGAVSPARYWLALPASCSEDRNWSAKIPPQWQGLQARMFVEAEGPPPASISGGIVSLQGKDPLVEAVPDLWDGNCLWDTARGAAAWRPVLQPKGKGTGGAKITDAGLNRIRVVPETGSGHFGALTNSVMIPVAAANSSSGLRIQVVGENFSGRIRVALLRETASLDEKAYETEIPVSSDSKPVEIPWDQFLPVSGAKPPVFPVDGLKISGDLPTGASLLVGEVAYLPEIHTQSPLSPFGKQNTPE